MLKVTISLSRLQEVVYRWNRNSQNHRVQANIPGVSQNVIFVPGQISFGIILCTTECNKVCLSSLYKFYVPEPTDYENTSRKFHQTV